jgi:hypothetical protein
MTFVFTVSIGSRARQPHSDFSDERLAFQWALKSRLVGGVIVAFGPYFTGDYGFRYFCPPICPPIWSAHLAVIA